MPTGETARIYAIFSAESACSAAAPIGYCGVRIVVDGNELNPAVGNDFAFDSIRQRRRRHVVVRVARDRSLAARP